MFRDIVENPLASAYLSREVRLMMMIISSYLVQYIIFFNVQEKLPT
jgi:hypothetical protein